MAKESVAKIGDLGCAKKISPDEMKPVPQEKVERKIVEMEEVKL